MIYNPELEDPEANEEFLSYIKEHAVCIADLLVASEDHVVLLSTCTPEGTNGRYILVGRMLEEVPENPFRDQE